EHRRAVEVAAPLIAMPLHRAVLSLHVVFVDGAYREQAASSPSNSQFGGEEFLDARIARSARAQSSLFALPNALSLASRTAPPLRSTVDRRYGCDDHALVTAR